MLHKLGRRPEPTSTDAVDALLECHRRIRHFTVVATRLASDPRLPPESIGDAAAAVSRYFTEALPLHSADEDESLVPRLRVLGIDHATELAMETMARQHGVLHGIIAELVQLWGTLVTEPASRGSHPADLVRLTQRLEILWDEHLTNEEEIVFPAARRLCSREVLGEIAAEIRARRVPSA